MPAWIKEFLNSIFNPIVYTVLGVGAFGALLAFYKTWTKPKVALSLLALLVAFFVASIPDPNFQKIVTKPDNVPIVALIFILGFFLWLSLRQAAINDERIAKGLPPREAEEANDRVLVWPDLVYEELICMVLFTVLLIVWSMALGAPLEEPANPGKTPNPSKAPWYFLGLQEMLVYFDPWIAGVVLPTMIITGLIAIPYCDKNPKGMGYYTVKERPMIITAYLFGFLVLWVLLIIMGTFLRGPNWNFFGPYEVWDVHKLESLTNVNLSEYFWVRWTGWGMPSVDKWGKATFLIRELPGIILVGGYMAVLPPLLAFTVFKKQVKEMGWMRYSIAVIHLIVMFAMIIKMVLRWTINLKYLICRCRPRPRSGRAGRSAAPRIRRSTSTTCGR
jgi:Cytochrome b(C-terminal)/b6/petD